MEVKLTDEKENKLLERRELRLWAIYTEKMPTRDEMRQEVSKKLSLDPGTLDIVRIDQVYGLKACEVTAYSYSSKEMMERLKRRKGKKEGAKPAEPKAEKPPAAPKEEKPAEAMGRQEDSELMAMA